MIAGSLLTARRFAPLFWCQFFSAFVDNFLKTALVFLILFKAGGAHADALITLAAGVFIAPFFFLSGLGGEFADRYDKAKIAQRLKFAEMGAAVIAVIGFLLQSVPMLFGALFLFGVIAALFGPIKYGILPDHLRREELPVANALVEGATFIAILLGTITGGLASTSHPVLLGVTVVVFSLLCWITSLFIPGTGEGAPGLKVRANIAASTAALMRHLRSDRRLFWGALVTSWFWLTGAVALSLLPPLVKNLLGGGEDVVTMCLALFSIGIGVGSGLAAWIAAGRIVLTTTLVGAVLLGVFALDLGWAVYGTTPAGQGLAIGAVFSSFTGARVAIDLVGMAIAGGLYIVPVFAAVQAWAGPDYRARVIAAVNVLNALFMAGSAVIVAVLQISGWRTPGLFLLLGAGCLLAALIIVRTIPSDIR